MAYNANIPQSTDQISASQAQILANFQALNSVGNGYITFIQQASDPTTLANELGLFAKDSPTSPGTTALFFRPENNGTAYDFTSKNAAGNGWMRLPNGILMKWISSSANGDTGLVNYPASTGPAFTTVFSGFAAPMTGAIAGDPDVAVTMKEFTTTQYRVYCSSRASTGAKAVAYRAFVLGT